MQQKIDSRKMHFNFARYRCVVFVLAMAVTEAIAQGRGGYYYNNNSSTIWDVIGMPIVLIILWLLYVFRRHLEWIPGLVVVSIIGMFIGEMFSAIGLVHDKDIKIFVIGLPGLFIAASVFAWLYEFLEKRKY